MDSKKICTNVSAKKPAAIDLKSLPEGYLPRVLQQMCDANKKQPRRAPRVKEAA